MIREIELKNQKKVDPRIELEKTIAYSDFILSLQHRFNDIGTFIDAVIRIRNIDNSTLEDAYEELERYSVKFYKRRKFESFESFRITKNDFLKRIKKT